jgi:purine-binding chemotaxis protein CheW
MNHDAVAPLEGEYVRCLIRDQEYGLRTSLVRDVINAPTVRRVPKAPAFFEGVANVGGRIIPVLNPVRRLGLPDTEQAAFKKMVVVRDADSLYGLLVDGVSAVARLSRDAIEPVNPVLVEDRTAFVSGLSAHDDRLLYLLDWHAFLRTGIKPDAAVQARYDSFAARRLEWGVRNAARTSKRFLAVKFGEDPCAIETAHVEEVAHARDIEPGAAFPGFVGVVRRRGKTFPVLDIGAKLFAGAAPWTDARRTVMLRVGGLRFGVLAHSAIGMIDVGEDEVRAAPAFSSPRTAGMVDGVAALDSGKRLFLILNPRGFLDQDDIERLNDMEGLDMSEDATASDERGFQKDAAFLIFRVADIECAFPVRRLVEVTRRRAATRVPKAPPSVKGIMSVKGELVSVMDLRTRFDLPAADEDAAPFTVILGIGDHKIGVAVDAVSEILRVPAKDITPVTEIMKRIPSRFVEGVIRIDKSDRAPLILDVDELVEGIDH